MTHRHLYLLLPAALLLASCGTRGGGKATPQPADTLPAHAPTRQAETRQVDNGDAREQAMNRNAAGFQTAEASRAVTVTQPCFATADPARLDMLPPTPDEATRRDTALVEDLNRGTVFILRPGDRGTVESVSGTKLLVRFQGGALWVWGSDVAR